MKPNLMSMTLNELENEIVKIGEKKFRAKQLFDWFYKKGITDINLMSNFSQEFKNKLTQNFEINIPQIEHVTQSPEDNSYKFLLKTQDFATCPPKPLAKADGKLIESILMLHPGRTTLCVSCMIGCPLKCKFCATGSEIGFIRNLDASEILGQIIAIQNHSQQNHNINLKITNIVFMGMGEPFLNLKNIQKVVEILLSKDVFEMSRSKITISTAGITQGLSDFINTYKINLAISLHFPTNEQRSKFMPINKKIPLEELIKEAKKITLGKRDYITIEYLMLDKVNDTLEHAKKLVKLLSTLKVKINLIPYNPTKNLSVNASSEKQINLFAQYLRSKSIMVTVRKSKGGSIDGACGQFALKK